jgi:hypothetical protein
LWLVVILGAVLLGGLFIWSGLRLPKCLWHQITGIPCPGCGSTRCVRALAAGDIGRALVMNPFTFLCFTFAMLYAVYAATVLAFRLPRLRLENIPSRIAWTARIGVAVAVLTNWVWLIVNRR